MIRFGAVATVVSAAVGVLIVGALSGDLALVYVSIGLAALALVMLVIGVAVWRDQVFVGSTAADRRQAADGRQAAVDQQARAHPNPVPAAPAQAGLSQAGRPAPAEDSWARTAAASGRQARPAREGALPQASGPGEHDYPPGRERSDRERAGRQPGSGGQLPAGAGRPGRQRDTVSADWAAPQPSPAGWPGQVAGAEDRPGRDASRSAGRAPRRPESAESHQAERAGAPEPPGRRPPGPEPYLPVEQPEPADDPTRLAHKLGIGRQPSPDDGSPTPSARPAEATAARAMRPDLAPESATEQRSSAHPLASPPAGSSAGRTRKLGTTGAEPEPAAAASGSAGASGRPEAAEEAAEPGSALAGTPVESPPPRGATPIAESASATADRETGGGGPAAGAATADGGTPTSSDASTAAAEGAGPAPGAADEAPGKAIPDGAPADTQVLVVPGIARYHQADCILIRFLGEDDLQRMSREEAEAAGCASCRACRP